MKKNNAQTGRVNYVWVLAGGYLWYLAFKLVETIWKGEAGGVLPGVLGALVFAAVGGLLFLREWKAYQYGKQHINDPETWSEGTGEELPEDEADTPEELTENQADTPEDAVFEETAEEEGQQNGD